MSLTLDRTPQLDPATAGRRAGRRARAPRRRRARARRPQPRRRPRARHRRSRTESTKAARSPRSRSAAAPATTSCSNETSGTRQRGRVGQGRTHHDVEVARRVAHSPNDGAAHRVQRHVERSGTAADQTERRLHAEQAAVRRRDADRAAAVAAGTRREQSRRDRRGRTARGPARCPRQVPRVASDSVQRCVREADGPVFGRGGQAREHRAGGAQARHLGVVVRGDGIRVHDRRVRLGPALDARELLHAHRDAGKRPRVGDRAATAASIAAARSPRRGDVEEAHRVQAPDRAAGSVRGARRGSRSREHSPERTASASSHASAVPERAGRARPPPRSGQPRRPPHRPPRACVSSANAASIPASSIGRSGHRSRSARRPTCTCPRYERTATPRFMFDVNGTSGYTSSIRAPRQ